MHSENILFAIFLDLCAAEIRYAENLLQNNFQKYDFTSGVLIKPTLWETYIYPKMLNALKCEEISCD